MKTLLLIFILIFSFSVFGQTAIVIIPKAVFRERPTPNAKVIFTVKKGAKFKLESEEHTNGWYYVSLLKGNVKGWIYGDGIKINNPNDNLPDLTKYEISNKKAKGDYIDELDKAVGFHKPGWFHYGTSKDSSFYYNAAKLTRQNSSIRVWTEQRNKDTNEVTSMILTELNCSTQRIRYLAGMNYKTNRSWDMPNAQFAVIFPDSVGEGLYKKVCKSK